MLRDSKAITVITAHLWGEIDHKCHQVWVKKDDKFSSWCVYFCVHTLPRPLMPLVSEWNINHSHQILLEKGAIILSIILLEHLTATIRTHWENQTPPRL